MRENKRHCGARGKRESGISRDNIEIQGAPSAHPGMTDKTMQGLQF
jgi:hypothetical protein